MIPPAAAAKNETGTPAFELTTAFAPEEPIPVKYTCDGEDISPPLAWENAPASTQSFALIADDPDAPRGTWVHWVLYNLPAETRTRSEAIPPDAELSDGSRHGHNSWGRSGYGGPCPPSGTHRYFFKLYALDTTLNLEAGANKEQLLQAMEGHVLSQAELMGTYTRK
jgi:Raf kinase inhibitor-like YbhB/YbcL family protein